MGAAKDASLLQTIVMGVINVIFTVVAILTVDKWGRKPLLMVGSIGMAIGMFALSALSYFEIISIGTLIFIIVYTASFMMSWGPICWVLNRGNISQQNSGESYCDSSSRAVGS